MPVGGRQHYYLRGAYLEFEGESLEEAIIALTDEWLTKASLAPHAPGNLVITLYIGSTSVTVEITEPSVITEMFTDPNAVLDDLAAHMNMPLADAQMILDQASAVVRVDTLRDPNHPDDWKPGVDPTRLTGAEGPEQVMPNAAAPLVGALMQQEDRRIRRDSHRPRTRYGRRLMELAITAGKQQGLTDKAIGQRIGAPRTTVRDARYRMERAEKIKQHFGTRTPGQRLTDAQKQIIRQELRRRKGNASRTARELGLPARTVRDFKTREARAAAQQRAARRSRRPAAAQPTPSRKKYTAQEKSQIVSQMIGRMQQTGESASEAGRALGVNPRTARSWIRQARLERDR